jgi:hypothetical protein
MLTATFTRNRSASGSVHAETSVDMENWTDSNVTETVLYLNGNIETIRATAETGNSQQSFIRLKYTQ